MTQYIEEEITVTIDVGDEEVTLQDIPIFATVDSTEATYWETSSCDIQVDVPLSRSGTIEIVRGELIAQELSVPSDIGKLGGKFLRQIKEQAREYVEVNC